MQMRALFSISFLLASFCVNYSITGFCHSTSLASRSAVTILCYMNGDNDLAEEVLHALDMMETVGSSDQVNVIALVDGHPQWLGPYGRNWTKARLLRLEADPIIGKIRSPVIETWGEVDMGSPETLTRFIRFARHRYPAQRYIFYTFAHGQGVIDTRRFAPPAQAKTVSISRDDSNGTNMNLKGFQNALQKGLSGDKFDLMVLFSCLSSMVEVSYSLSSVTDYLVASEDEIRLLNKPSGTYQIRGLQFETLIASLHPAPFKDPKTLGRLLVDSHVQNYERDIVLGHGAATRRFSGGMTLLDTRAAGELTGSLDKLARLLIRYAENRDVVAAVRRALSTTQRFASFLNLEYYDLQGLIGQLQQGVIPSDLQMACDQSLKVLKNRVIVYERHTADYPGMGMSIYLSNPLVPDNIYQAHQIMYQACRFSRDTLWDEMIDTLRQRIKTDWRSSNSHLIKKSKGGLAPISRHTRP